MNRPSLRSAFGRCLAAGPTLLTTLLVWIALTTAALAAPLTPITVDGDFNDWGSVATFTDPDGGPGVLHGGVYDVHDTDHDTPGGKPSYVDHPDVDILAYKFTHDANTLYAYFRADGVIGATQNASLGKAGRYYVIVTIDVDDDDATGYFLHEGGYYPTSGVDRYDMNMEAEFYAGELNTAHYLSHDALGPENGAEIREDFANLTVEGYVPTDVDDVDVPGPPGPYTPGFAQPAPGNYDNYTQWVYHDDDTLTLVQDRGPVVPGIMSVALSADGHELELAAPFKGFLNNASGEPNIALGKTIDVSFSLEASGELAPGGEWASDTADPIVDYVLESYPGDFTFDGIVDAADLDDPTNGWQARFGSDLAGSDLLDWQRNFGRGATRIINVPEPGAAWLACAGLWLPAALQWKRR